MNPYWKLFLAAGLVTGGVAVARMLGEPAANSHPSRPGWPSLQTHAAVVKDDSASGGARLMPDFSPSELGNATGNHVVASPPLLLVETTPAADSVPIRKDDRIAPPRAPQAKLRNEAPRPLAIDERAQAVTGRSSPSPPEVRSDSFRPPGVMPAGFDARAETSRDGTSQLAAPAWPAPEENRSLRTHIVADGDSLAKLAARYLGDAERGKEIYELNRGVLPDADLLPIGAELVIPERTAVDRDGRSSRAVPRNEIHTASGSLVPVRPTPPASSVSPRAQLLPPRPVE